MNVRTGDGQAGGGAALWPRAVVALLAPAAGSPLRLRDRKPARREELGAGNPAP